MVGEQIQRSDTPGVHVPADEAKHFSRNPLAAFIFLHVDSTDVWRQILPIVKIVFNHAKSADNSVPFECSNPLRNSASSSQAIFHTFLVCFQRNTPFFMKPAGQRVLQFRPVLQSDYGDAAHFLASSFLLSKHVLFDVPLSSPRSSAMAEHPTR